MKFDFNDLIKAGGLIKEEKIGFDQVARFLKRARKDLLTAKKIISTDEAVALDLVYKAMFHSANALIRFLGFRPGRIGQHKAIIRATERILGKSAEIYILRFDKLRQKRNYFEYGAGFASSKTEIENNLKEADKFIDLVEKFLEKKSSQRKLF